MSTQLIIFGVGSLINEASLRRTVPDVTILGTAYLYGYVRIFSVPARSGHIQTYGNQYFAITPVEGARDDWINGSYFLIEERDLPALKRREANYRMEEIMIYPYGEETPITAYTFFSDDKDERDLDMEKEMQQQYLHICLEGAASFGELFLEEFKSSTYVKGRDLKEWGY